MVTRVQYWSCTKFSDKIRALGGIQPKLNAGTSKEWNDWTKAAKVKSKFFFWLADDGLDFLQDLVNWPRDKIDQFAYWINKRFIRPSHLIRTGLEKGVWHETEEKILHGMFEELIDFVECQKASMNLWCDSKKRPWYRKYLPYWFNQIFLPVRSQQLGIDYLLWEINLKKDDEWFGYTWREETEGKDVIDKERQENSEYMKPTPQGAASLEILELYVWWKFIRPMRQDPMDESGYTDYFERNRSEDDSIWETLEKDGKDKEEWKKYSDKCHELEEAQFKEDEEMMVRLIKVRRALWT